MKYFRVIHDPLISTELFQQVEVVRNGKCGKKTTKHNHTYRGLFRCTHCSYAMIPEKQKLYVYYRCQQPECPGNCIREEMLEKAISRVLDKVKLSDQHIAAIQCRVQQWCQDSDKANSNQTHAMHLQQVKQRLEKLEDAAIEQIIDADSFARRKEKLLIELASIKKVVEKSEQNSTNPATVQKFLERVKNLGRHYRFAESVEKREIAEIATSNRRVKSKYAFVEPAKWLDAVQQSLAVLSCAEYRTTSRTSPDMPDGQSEPALPENTAAIEGFSEIEIYQIEQLIEVAHSSQAQRVYRMFMDEYCSAAFGMKDYQSDEKGL